MYSPHRKLFLFCTPTLGYSSLTLYFSSKMLTFKTPLPRGIPDDLPWGGYGFFLDCTMQNLTEHANTWKLRNPITGHLGYVHTGPVPNGSDPILERTTSVHTVPFRFNISTSVPNNNRPVPCGLNRSKKSSCFYQLSMRRIHVVAFKMAPKYQKEPVQGPVVQRPDNFIRWIRHYSGSKIYFTLNIFQGFRTLPNLAVVRMCIFAYTLGNTEIFAQIETVR